MKAKWLALAAAGLFQALPVQAQTTGGEPIPPGASGTLAEAAMVRAQDPQTVMHALQLGGYAAQLGTDRVGDPMITSAVSGTTFQIFFYNCTDHQACATVQFHSRYAPATPISLEWINDWNSRKRFGRAYLDKTSAVNLDMDVDLDDGGISPLLFIDNIEFWASILVDFERHIGVREPAPTPL